MKLKSKPNVYEITFSLRSDPNTWNRTRVEEPMLLLKIAELLGNDKLNLECVALVATSRPNRYDLPTE